MKTIKEFDLKGKKVLLRVDINSPVVGGKIKDSPRLIEAANTISYLAKKKAKVVIIAHQGRKGDNDYLPLKQHARLLTKHSKNKVTYINSLFEIESKIEIVKLKEGQILLLKNVRDYADEKEVNKNGNLYEEFCTQFDIYINDAFSVSHRAQGSIILPPKFIKNHGIGPNFEKELQALEKLKMSGDGKGVYLIGGAKVEDYLPLFNVLENKNNVVLASGVLANLFFVAKGVKLGYEEKWLEEKGYFSLIPSLKTLLDKYPQQIILPCDFAFGDKERIEKPLKDAPFKEKIWDVGEGTTEIFKRHIKEANSIFMKGPLGFSEIKIFSNGTVNILKEISERTKKGAFSLLGGGHLSTSIKEYRIPNKFSYISTSGGALIAYISGEEMPGISALS